MGIARATIVGTISKAVEMRYAPSGAPHADFVLRVRELGHDGQQHDLYVGCECWGKRVST